MGVIRGLLELFLSKAIPNRWMDVEKRSVKEVSASIEYTPLATAHIILLWLLFTTKQIIECALRDLNLLRRCVAILRHIEQRTEHGTAHFGSSFVRN